MTLAVAMDVDDNCQTDSVTTSSNDPIMVQTPPPSSSSVDACDDYVTILKAMKQSEVKYRVGDYLHRLSEQQQQPTNPSKSESYVNAECRHRMCQWSFSVADFCHYQKDTVAVSMKILDRFLDVTPWVLQDRSAFQLAALTSMYMAVKLIETAGLPMKQVAELSKGAFTIEQFEAMERAILEAANWFINPPTATQMGYRMAQWMSSLDHRLPLDALLDLINMQLEAAVFDYYLVTAAPSLLSVAALFNAMEGMAVHTPEELRQIRHMVTSTLDISPADLKLLPQAQVRLYELLSGDPSRLTSTTKAMVNTAPSSTSTPSTIVPYTVDSNSCGSINNDVRPISPNSVSGSPSAFETPQPNASKRNYSFSNSLLRSLFG